MNPALRTLPVVLIAAGALFLGASGGAVAGSLITGKDIKDNTVTTKDIKNKTLTTQDLAPATVASLVGATGSPGPQGVAGPKGETGAKGDPGTPGLVRAYARVSSSGVVSSQSGGITATTPFPGTTCVTIPGLSSDTSPWIISLDYSGSSSSSTNQAYAEPSPLSCSAPAFGVKSWWRDAAAGTRTDATQPFFILVP